MDRFHIETAHFSGPLDALLNLIEARKLSISLVSLSEVCDGYLAYVEQLPELPLAETSQFILVASTLLLIKSRTLLPGVVLSDDETQSIEELEKRLARYAVIRRAAKLMRAEWGIHQLFFPRRTPATKYTGGAQAAFNPGETAIQTILQAGQKLLATLPKPEKLAEATVAPVLALEEAIAGLKERLTRSFKARWSEITRTSDKHEAIVHFLAILELVRNGSVSVTQEKLFSDILVENDTVTTPYY